LKFIRELPLITGRGDVRMTKPVTGKQAAGVAMPEQTGFETVRRTEWDFIYRRRGLTPPAAKPGKPSPPPSTMFGVGLSGGGIRSATFCLGAMQALDAFKGIARIDYLSTVSGGGYLGAGMVAAMVKNGGHFPYSVQGEKAVDRSQSGVAAPTPGQAAVSDMGDSEAVGHIRDHSRYLVPHGISDVLLSVSVVLRGLAVNFFLIFALLLPLALITVIANPTRAHLRHSVISDVLPIDWLDRLLLPFQPFALTAGVGLVMLAYLMIWGLFRSLRERHGFSSLPKGQDARLTLGTFGGQLVGLLLIAAAAIEAQGPILDWLAEQSLKTAASPQATGSFGYWDALVTVLTAVLAIVTGLRKRFADWIEKGAGEAGMLVQLRSIVSKLMLFGAALILPFLIYLGYLTISLWAISVADMPYLTIPPQTQPVYPFAPGFVTSAATTEVLVCVVGVLILWEAYIFLGRERGRKTLYLLGRRIHALGLAKGFGTLAAVVAFFAFFTAAAMVTRGDRIADLAAWHPENFTTDNIILFNYLLTTIAVILLTSNFSYNANSLHRLYRDRLNVAFRYGGGPTPEEMRDPQKYADRIEVPLPLASLNENAPYLLINSALNARISAAQHHDRAPDLASARHLDLDFRAPDPVKRGRNADFFLFSANYIGSESTGYVRTDKLVERDPEIDLAAAVAISGAAFSSNMGRANIGVLSPTLALLNIRLGYWLDNPLYCQKQIEDLPPDLPWHDFFRAYLVAESFGLLRTDSSKIYVTDGGHVDNLGLYQLLRRRCKYIIVVDAEADPAMNFGALVDVERFARIDLGIRIKIDFTNMQKAAASRQKAPSAKASDGTAKGSHVDKDDPVHDCHFAVGEIDYGNDKDGLPETGTLIYLKAVVTGDEPDYVLDYERRYPLFPHESTGDQFFSEEQMEAYRALGFHAMQRMLTEKPKVAAAITLSGSPPPSAAAAAVTRMKNDLEIERETL
jgi:hypothetical protein